MEYINKMILKISYTIWIILLIYSYKPCFAQPGDYKNCSWQRTCRITMFPDTPIDSISKLNYGFDNNYHFTPPSISSLSVNLLYYKDSLHAIYKDTVNIYADKDKRKMRGLFFIGYAYDYRYTYNDLGMKNLICDLKIKHSCNNKDSCCNALLPSGIQIIWTQQYTKDTMEMIIRGLPNFFIDSVPFLCGRYYIDLQYTVVPKKSLNLWYRAPDMVPVKVINWDLMRTNKSLIEILQL
jgi:hypothetical protein